MKIKLTSQYVTVDFFIAVNDSSVNCRHIILFVKLSFTKVVCSVFSIQMFTNNKNRERQSKRQNTNAMAKHSSNPRKIEKKLGSNVDQSTPISIYTCPKFTFVKYKRYHTITSIHISPRPKNKINFAAQDNKII